VTFSIQIMHLAIFNKERPPGEIGTQCQSRIDSKQRLPAGAKNIDDVFDRRVEVYLVSGIVNKKVG
jgi:hypothetical protein